MAVSIDPAPVAARLGIVVSTFPLSHLNGVLIHDGLWKIGVSRHLSPARRRFTIAHEIGHYVLHRQQQRCFLCREGATGILEIEANEYAAELLMPAEEVYEWALRLDEYDRAAQHFGVSRAALEARINDLAQTTRLGTLICEESAGREQRHEEPSVAATRMEAPTAIWRPPEYRVRCGRRWVPGRLPERWKGEFA